MGLIIIVFILIGSITYTEACSECGEVSAENPVIHEYLANTLQSISTSPSGLLIQEQIEVNHILKASFQVVKGIKFYYEFEGIGSKSKNVYVCNLVIIRRAWLNQRSIEKYSCQQNGFQEPKMNNTV